METLSEDRVVEVCHAIMNLCESEFDPPGDVQYLTAVSALALGMALFRVPRSNWPDMIKAMTEDAVDVKELFIKLDKQSKTNLN